MIGLTARQEEVLRLRATGLGEQEIATALGVSQPTVKNHISAINHKFDVRSSIASMYALGWINPDFASGTSTSEVTAERDRAEAMAADALARVAASAGAIARQRQALRAIADLATMAADAAHDALAAYAYAMAEILRLAEEVLPACDYCSEGNVAVGGWHALTDPEGIEGTNRVWCART